jgi:single-stranded DNA-binding protein
MSSTERKIVTLFGNVGKDPELHTTPAKEITKEVYDPVVDAVVEKIIPLPENDFHTFSIAINYDDPDTGEEEVRWVDCVDWEGLCRLNLVRKGDRVALQGYFKQRVSAKPSGERAIYRNFVVEALQVERRKRAPEVP